MIRLGTRGLAHTRFAISPLQEICGLLELVARPGLAAPDQWRDLSRTQAAMRDGGLDLLAGLTAPGYLPDLFTPHPEDADGDVVRELRAVRETPPERVLAEVDAMRTGRPAAGMEARRPAPAVTAALQDGPAAFTARSARELEHLWNEVLARRWGRMRAMLVADIARRGAQLAREGAAALLDALHPDIRWDDDKQQLRIESRYRVQVHCDDTLVLVPSAVRRRPNVLIDPCAGERRPPVVCYPVDPLVDVRDDSAERAAELLGATRARLLHDLACARTTTDLAARHYLTPSSVSYHLGVLYRAGLATRTREGARVLYLRTARADALLVGCPAG